MWWRRVSAIIEVIMTAAAAEFKAMEKEAGVELSDDELSEFVGGI